ncbi:MAG: sugar ABC transporter permease [Defluviitaleaceae bacterium]|nr:sugar ABC transporter permease [Defluviitaleaceae bacterium]
MKEKKLTKRVSYAKYGYIFSAPFVIAFLVFQLYPLIFTTSIGFTNMQGMIMLGAGLGDATFTWNNDQSVFYWFSDVFNSDLFRRAFQNTILIWFLNFIPQMVLALALAALFTNSMLKLKFVGFFKIMFYMPNIITAGSIAMLFSTLFGHPIGPVNDFLQMTGLREGPTNILNNVFWANPLGFSLSLYNSQVIIAFIQFWMWYGVTMIILIAGIMGISPTLFEAAAIDGASHIKTFIHVTLPSLRTILLFTLVTSFVGGMQMFDIPRLFQDGEPRNATLTTSLFIFQQGFSTAHRFNRAAAASMLMFIFICIISITLFYVMRDKDAAKDKRERRARRRAKRELEAARRAIQ